MRSFKSTRGDPGFRTDVVLPGVRCSATTEDDSPPEDQSERVGKSLESHGSSHELDEPLLPSFKNHFNQLRSILVVLYPSSYEALIE